MSSDFDKPINTTPYLTVWDYVRDNIDLVSTWFDELETPGTNIPINAKRFSIANKRFEYYNGYTWLELLDQSTTAYKIRVEVADLADLATSATTSGACIGNAATASLATNSLQLGGYLAADITKNSDIRPVSTGGTGATTVGGIWNMIASTAEADLDPRYVSSSEAIGTLIATADGTHTVTLGYRPAAVLLVSQYSGLTLFTTGLTTLTATGFSFSMTDTHIYHWVAIR